jgi:RNA polymerase-binding transcription factor DksA
MLDIGIQKKALQAVLREMESPDVLRLRRTVATPLEGQDDLERASGALDKEIAAYRMNQRYMKIAKARVAAAKLNQGLGAYMVCSLCGEGTITERRLTAAPWEILCEECRARQERDKEEPPDLVRGNLDPEIEFFLESTE